MFKNIYKSPWFHNQTRFILKTINYKTFLKLMFEVYRQSYQTIFCVDVFGVGNRILVTNKLTILLFFKIVAFSCSTDKSLFSDNILTTHFFIRAYESLKTLRFWSKHGYSLGSLYSYITTMECKVVTEMSF